MNEKLSALKQQKCINIIILLRLQDMNTQQLHIVIYIYYIFKNNFLILIVEN